MQLAEFAAAYLRADSLADASTSQGLRTEVGAQCLAWLGVESRKILTALCAAAQPSVRAFTVWRVRGFVERRGEKCTTYVANGAGVVNVSVESGEAEVEASKLAANLGRVWPGARVMRGDRQKRDGSDAVSTNLDSQPRLSWVTEEVLGCHVGRDTLLAGLLWRALVHNVVDGSALPPALGLGLVAPGHTIESVVATLLAGLPLLTSPSAPREAREARGEARGDAWRHEATGGAREGGGTSRRRTTTAPRPRAQVMDGAAGSTSVSISPAASAPAEMTWQRAAALFRRDMIAMRAEALRAARAPRERGRERARAPSYRPPREVRARASAIAIAAMAPPHNIRRRVVARHMGLSKETLLRYLRECAPSFVDNLSVLELELVVPALKEIARRVAAPARSELAEETPPPPEQVAAAAVVVSGLEFAPPAHAEAHVPPNTLAAVPSLAPAVVSELRRFNLLDVVRRALMRRGRGEKDNAAAPAQLVFDWFGGDRVHGEGAKA